MTTYHVTRQNGFYDDEPRVEIALGLDNVSPGMLVAKYGSEGQYDDASEAVEEALGLAHVWAADAKAGSPYAVTVSSAAWIGCYPTSDDGMSTVELREWAAKRCAIDEPEHDDDYYEED